MALAIFDLDQTLLKGDSAASWNVFVADQGLVEKKSHLEKNKAFNRDYHNGVLDIHGYMEFIMCLFPVLDKNVLIDLRDHYIKTIIEPMILPKGLDLLKSHREKGDYLLMITATIKFIAEPIANFIGMDDMIGTIPETKDGKFTGKVAGIPSFQKGKITHLENWLEKKSMDLSGAFFYTDSHNDLPLLEKIEHPVAVNPDSILLEHAKQKGWQVLDLI